LEEVLRQQDKEVQMVIASTCSARFVSRSEARIQAVLASGSLAA